MPHEPCYTIRSVLDKELNEDSSLESKVKSPHKIMQQELMASCVLVGEGPQLSMASVNVTHWRQSLCEQFQLSFYLFLLVSKQMGAHTCAPFCDTHTFQFLGYVIEEAHGGLSQFKDHVMTPTTSLALHPPTQRSKSLRQIKGSFFQTRSPSCIKFDLDFIFETVQKVKTHKNAAEMHGALLSGPEVQTW